MSAGDALGSCRNRGRTGHLPHPDGTPCLWREQDGTTPVPGVYSADQVATDYTAPAPREAWLEGYRYALLNPDDPGVQADLARYQAELAEQRERLVDQLQEELQREREGTRVYAEQQRTLTGDLHRAREQAKVLREDAETNARRAEEAEQDAARYKDDHLRCCVLVADMHAAATGREGEGPWRGVVEDVADVRAERDKLKAETERLAKGWEQAYQQGWRQNEDQRLTYRRERDQARDHAAECMRETAQLHRALDSLGTDPERLAEQVGAGDAVCLFGRVYVARELLHMGTPGPTDATAECELVGQPLLEAQSGLFVPIPAGHMLSVTVTPYDSTPDVEHVCSLACGNGSNCPPR